MDENEQLRRIAAEGPNNWITPAKCAIENCVDSTAAVIEDGAGQDSDLYLCRRHADALVALGLHDEREPRPPSAPVPIGVWLDGRIKCVDPATGERVDPPGKG